jgi:cell division protease FtsH
VVGKEYSEATAAKLDEEVKGILEEREQHVRNILMQHRVILEQIAQKLLQTEVMDSEEFYRMVEEAK